MKKFYLFLILLSISCMGVRCEMFDHDINPRLIYTDPVKNDRNVPANTSIMFMFDWHIKPHTLKSDTIYLETNDGTIIYGKGEFYGTKVIIFTPQKNNADQEFALEKLTEYKVVVKDDLIDTNKMRLKKTYKFKIATSNKVDGIRPRVESINLDKNKKDIYIQFSEKINLLTINSNTIKLEQMLGASRRSIEGKIKYNEEKNRVTFKSKEKLKDENIYSLTVSNLIEDLCSNQLLTVCTKIFAQNNASDTTPPTVVNYEKEISDVINVKFSEALDPFTLQSGSAVLLIDETGKNHEVGVDYNDSTQSIKITPVKELPNKTSYTLTIFGGSIGVKDIYQNAMVENFTFEFHKAVNAAPVVTFTNFEEENGGITGDDPIRIMFDKPLMKSSVTENSFKVATENGEVAGTRELTSGDRILTFKPTDNDGNFEYDIEYNVVLTTDIKDADGYELEEEVGWKFEAIDDSPLTIVNTKPKDNNICYTNDPVQIVFSKKIILDTLYCTIKNSDNIEIPIPIENINHVDEDRIIEITPPISIVAGQTYTITVYSDLEDKYGVKLGYNFNYTFYTGAVSGENAVLPAPGYATFGGTNELRKDDASLLKSSATLNSSISGLFDASNTGRLSSGKSLRMLVNWENIVKENKTNFLTPIYKSIPVFTGYAYTSPPANQVYVDLANRRVVLPRPSYWSMCETLANLTSGAEIKERAPSYVKSGKGKFSNKRVAGNNFSIEFKNQSVNTRVVDNYNNGTINLYPISQSVNQSISGSISLDLNLEIADQLETKEHSNVIESSIVNPRFGSKSVLYIFNQTNLILYFVTQSGSDNVTIYLNVNGVAQNYKLSSLQSKWMNIFVAWNKNSFVNGNNHIEIYVNNSLRLSSNQALTAIGNHLLSLQLISETFVEKGSYNYRQNNVEYPATFGGYSGSAVLIDNIKIWNHDITTGRNIYTIMSDIENNINYLHPAYSIISNIKVDYYYLP